MWRKLQEFNPSTKDLTLKSQALVELGVLKVLFEIEGPVENLLISTPGLHPARVIGLWESTCFEMFVKHTSKDEYFEFNCSTANNWNIFYFLKEKAALKEYLEISNLASSTIINPGKVSLSFWIDLKKFPDDFWEDGKMQLGLTSVIESKDGGLSYWALDHLDKKPNFHLSKSFTYQL